MNDAGIIVSVVGLALAVVVSVVAMGRWCGRMETLRKTDHDAMFDGDGTPKWNTIHDDVTWIRAKLGNGLFRDVECLKDDGNDFRERIARLEAAVGGRRKTNGVPHD